MQRTSRTGVQLRMEGEDVISHVAMDDVDKALLICLEDEESSDEERSKESDIFKSRCEEGAFQILVVCRLYCNEEKFREYFRSTTGLFDYILNPIRNDITSKPFNRH